MNSYNSTLIVGVNGSGKSTVLDALTFVLFGKSYREINKPQLLNTITKRNLVVEIEFTIGESNYLVRRGMQPTIFEIYQNKKLLNPAADSRDYQSHFEKNILGANYKSFCQVVVLGSASFKPFMKLQAAQKREIIEDLLNLEIFTLMNILLKKRIEGNYDNLYEVYNQKRIVEEKLELLVQHANTINIATEQETRDYEKENEYLKKKADTLKNEIKKYEASIQELNEKIKDEFSYNTKLNQYSSFEYKLNTNFDTLQKEIKFFKYHEHCPTCEQKIDVDFQKSAISSRELKVNEILDGLVKLDYKRGEILKKLTEFKTMRNLINDLKLEVQNNMNKIQAIVIKQDMNTEAIERLSRKDTVMIENIDENKKTLREILSNVYKLEEEKTLFHAASLILKDSGIKAKIIKQYIPVMNQLINKYLSELELFAQFELDENFSESIKSRYRDKFSYESFSQGERFRIDIALLFAWRDIAKFRNSIATNLLIMDEIFDSPLDADGIEFLFKMLTNLKNANVFIISPKADSISDKFENLITFQKKKNFSRIH